MSGHSKWAQIKRKKAVTDAKRGRLFSKLAKVLELSAKKGTDIKTNLGLKAAIDQAKSFNMPAANIERAIKKGSGQLTDATSLEEVVYEAYGPGGVAMLIMGVTDNKNRTVAEIKHILAKCGATLGGAGSVKWLFDQKYQDSEVQWIAKQNVKLSEADEGQLENLLTDLDDNEDVVDVFTNVE